MDGEPRILTSAQVVVRAATTLADLVLAFGKHPPRDRLAEPRGFVVRECVQVVETEAQQLGDLLDHFNGIRDAAGPERVPDLVDRTLDGASDHREVL